MVLQSRKKLIKRFVVNLLTSFGENISREGLVQTPDRVFRMYEELLSGYRQDPAEIFITFPSNGRRDLVTITNIRFYSLCEHHMVPFFGNVHIGYVPNGKVLGLSKFARLIDIYSHRLQTQENLTHEIAEALTQHLKPKGLVVGIEAEHLCMSMRGIKKTDCTTKTSSIRGLLKTSHFFLDQFYREIGEGRRR